MGNLGEHLTVACTGGYSLGLLSFSTNYSLSCTSFACAFKSTIMGSVLGCSELSACANVWVKEVSGNRINFSVEFACLGLYFLVYMHTRFATQCLCAKCMFRNHFFRPLWFKWAVNAGSHQHGIWVYWVQIVQNSCSWNVTSLRHLNGHKELLPHW